MEAVAKKLFGYRDLLINSGAWQRQWDYFKTKSAKPCIVENLSEEIGYIVEWYKNRYNEMDDYFNIAADIENIKTYSDDDSYDLQGRKIKLKSLQKGIYLKNGRKIIVR